MRSLILTMVAIGTLATVSAALEPAPLDGILLDAQEAFDGQQVVYRLKILVGKQYYEVEQRPIFFLNVYMPHEFFINGPVRVRLTSRNLYLMRPNGKEMRMTILFKQIMDEQHVAALTRHALRPVSTDKIADMLNAVAEQRALVKDGVADGK